MLPDEPPVPERIDIGEAILATIGVRPLLTREVERIRAPQWREIGRIEQTVTKRAQELARGTLERLDSYPEVDYQSALKAFATPPEPAQIEAMLVDIPMPAVMPFLTAAARAYNFLRGQYPIAVEHTVFGDVQLEPGQFALGMFEDLLEAVDRPLSLFNMAETGRITTKQAAAVQAVYPSLYNEMTVSLVLACMDEKAKKQSWEPDFERGMSVLLGIPGIDPNLRTQLMAPPPAEPAPKPNARPGKSDRAHLIATKSDRLDLDE